MSAPQTEEEVCEGCGQTLSDGYIILKDKWSIVEVAQVRGCANCQIMRNTQFKAI